MKNMMIILSLLLASVSIQCCEKKVTLSLSAARPIAPETFSKAGMNLSEIHNALRAARTRNKERIRLAELRRLRKESELSEPRNNGILSPMDDIFPFSPDNGE